MADLEDVTLDGRPLQSLRVADLKAALEERGLSKSGQKNALIKRLKGALMLENLQRTSTAHVGLQPNSQIGEEMSQNSFIKQYLAKQQELLRQRLEREAREGYETNDQEEHNEVNNSTCPPQPQDSPAVADHFKPPGPSSGQAVPEGLSHRNQDAAVSRPPASVSVAQDRNEGAADSDEEDSEDGEDDADDDDDWDSNIQRRLPRQPVRAPMARERSAASCQPQQQHIPSLLSPQLRQPTPPPSPPPELSFPLPDTPKQSPPSPDVAPAGRSPTSSSSGSSSSGSRSSSPEPHSAHAERKPGPLTLLARKMESEGAFSGAGWHGRDTNRQDNCSSSITFPGRVHPEGLVSPIPHTLTAGHAPTKLGTNQSHAQVSINVLKPSAEKEAELERVKSLDLQRQEQQKKREQERAMEEERVRAALEKEVKRRALEKEQLEREQALEREKTLQMERERREKERALAKEREERERALELERQKELERQIALEKELALQREREEREQREREEQERALEQERLERERALEAERMERERVERERALEQERLERERALEAERMERERVEKEKALEQERLEKERALEAERMERERVEKEKALEQQRLERDRLEMEAALERERLEKKKALEKELMERQKIERIEREKALEKERIEQERLEQEKALEKERIEREKALEKQRIEQERLEQEKALEKQRIEQERIEKEKALERERIKQEKIEQEKAAERERIEREKAIERERIEREEALERERIEQEKAFERARLEQLERERALEQQRLVREKEQVEQERIQREKAIEQEKEKTEKEQLQKEKAEQERMEGERKAKERAVELEKLRSVEHDSLEKVKAAQKENAADESRMAEVKSKSHLPPRRGCEIGFIPLPTPPPLSTGPSRKASTEAVKPEGEGHGPVSCDEGRAEESETPKSPQSPFKKFRLLRDIPQPQAASIAIKRSRTFSDSPQPCASVMAAINAEDQQQKGQSADLEDFARQLTSEGKPVDALESAKNGGATNLVSEAKKEFEKNEAAVKECIQNAAGGEDFDRSSPVDVAARGRDVKKVDKQNTQRSSSNESSSSESDSDSSSSHSSNSSSPEKTYTSPQRRDESPERDTLLNLVKVSKTDQKTMPPKISTKMQLNEAPNRDDKQRRKSSKDDDGKPERTRQGVEPGITEPEKDSEAPEEIPKVFSARKISLSSSKSSPGTENDHESGSAGGRKRRWGSSTAVTAKKPTISITTDSLKSLIPDIRPALNQEAVVDLHPEEPAISETEDEDKDSADQELQIRRTVTQVVNVENQENGQKEAKRWRGDSEDDAMQGESETKTCEESMDTQALETPLPFHVLHETEINTVTPSDAVLRRSISQQKTSVSITIDDPVRTTRQPSPPRGKVSNIVHVCNLVRPFTLGQLKELLSRTGSLVEDGFWIDKIKSHCYVTYSTSEEAVATRAALHGVKWPQSNPKFLCVDFCQQDELDFHKGLGSGARPGAEEQSQGRVLPSLFPEREQWAEREREMERRERARAEREWDRDKVKEFGKPEEEKDAGTRRSRSRERRHKERGKSKEKKTEKKEKAADDPPAKLLDDLFRKTKAAPCIYWLPLTEEQFLQREAARAERRKEREKQRKKEEEEGELKKREEENKERMKVGGCITGDRSENEKDKVRDRDRGRDRGREREREREADKRRDVYRRPGGNAAPSGRRSRSRSDPRERRH